MLRRSLSWVSFYYGVEHMIKRIYKHICKECETVFYVEDLKLLSACYCPRPECQDRGLYIGEFNCEQS